MANATATANGGSKSDCIAGFIDNGSVESSRYFLSRRTVLEMLQDRGYNVPDLELIRSLHEFRSLFGEQPNPKSLRLCVSHRSDPSNKVLFVFMGNSDVKKATLRDLNEQILSKERFSRLILIVQSKMTTYARKQLELTPFKVEIFNINDLLVNITKHVQQPKYMILTADEKQVLLRKYKVEEKQLPLMQKSDAIARYYGLEKGQVVKITYSGKVVDSLVSYRCVA